MRVGNPTSSHATIKVHEILLAGQKESSICAASMLSEFDNEGALLDSFSSTIKYGSGPWVPQENAPSPVDSTDVMTQQKLFRWEPLQMHCGLKHSQCQSDAVADEGLTILERSWLIMCQKRAMESVFSGNVGIIVSNFVMPWEFANILLVGKSCREKRTVAKLAATQIGARWLAPELHKSMSPISCFKSAVSEVQKLLLKVDTPVVLYLSRYFSDDTAMLSVLQNLIVEGDIIQFSEDNKKHSGLLDILSDDPRRNRGIDQQSDNLFGNAREKLRIVISMEEERYEEVVDSHKTLLGSLSIKMLSASQEDDLFAYCLKSIGEYNSCEVGCTRKTIKSQNNLDLVIRGLSDVSSINHIQPDAQGVGENYSEHTQEQLDNPQHRLGSQYARTVRTSPIPGDQKSFERDETLLLVQILTALHTVTGAWLKTSLPQTKLDEALAVYRYIYTASLENLHRYKSHHTRSLKHLNNIAYEIKKGNVLIKECRSKIQV